MPGPYTMTMFAWHALCVCASHCVKGKGWLSIYITLHYIKLHYITYIHTYTHTLRTIHYITIHYITLHTIHYIPYITYHTLHYITLHYITLHTNIYIYIFVFKNLQRMANLDPPKALRKRPPEPTRRFKRNVLRFIATRMDGWMDGWVDGHLDITICHMSWSGGMNPIIGSCTSTSTLLRH